jgi:hypothetical protein
MSLSLSSESIHESIHESINSSISLESQPQAYESDFDTATGMMSNASFSSGLYSAEVEEQYPDETVNGMMSLTSNASLSSGVYSANEFNSIEEQYQDDDRYSEEDFESMIQEAEEPIELPGAWPSEPEPQEYVNDFEKEESLEETIESNETADEFKPASIIDKIVTDTFESFSTEADLDFGIESEVEDPDIIQQYLSSRFARPTKFPQSPAPECINNYLSSLLKKKEVGEKRDRMAGVNAITERLRIANVFAKLENPFGEEEKVEEKGKSVRRMGNIYLNRQTERLRLIERNYNI